MKQFTQILLLAIAFIFTSCFEKEAKALQKNLIKRKKQQEEREKLKKMKEENNG